MLALLIGLPLCLVLIAAAPGAMQLSELCLARESGFLCAQGELKNEVGAARIDAEGLQLGWFSSHGKGRKRAVKTIHGSLTKKSDREEKLIT